MQLEPFRIVDAAVAEILIEAREDLVRWPLGERVGVVGAPGPQVRRFGFVDHTVRQHGLRQAEQLREIAFGPTGAIEQHIEGLYVWIQKWHPSEQQRHFLTKRLSVDLADASRRPPDDVGLRPGSTRNDLGATVNSRDFSNSDR